MNKHQIVFLIALLTCLTLIALPAYAATEIEPNNDDSTATAITVNTPVSASFTNGWDWHNREVMDHDWYKVTLTQPGNLQLKFNKPTKSEVYVYVYSVNASGARTLDYYNTFYQLANPVVDYVEEESDNLYFPAGDYYFDIHASLSNGSKTDYTMTVVAPEQSTPAPISPPSRAQETGSSPGTVITIVIQIGSSNMYVNGNSRQIYPGENASPMVVNDRTLVPIRAIAEELGAVVEWDGNTQNVTIRRNGTVIIMRINSTAVNVNGQTIQSDVAPQIIDNRTMIPLRIVAETLNCEVNWEPTTKTVTITGAP